MNGSYFVDFVQFSISNAASKQARELNRGDKVSIVYNVEGMGSYNAKFLVKLDRNQKHTSSSEDLAIKNEKEAIFELSKYLGSLPKGFSIRFDHIQDRDGKKYYMLQYYESIIDNMKTGEGHSATIAWYYVEESTGSIYKLDIIANNLTLVG